MFAETCSMGSDASQGTQAKNSRSIATATAACAICQAMRLPVILRSNGSAERRARYCMNLALYLPRVRSSDLLGHGTAKPPCGQEQANEDDSRQQCGDEKEVEDA